MITKQARQRVEHIDGAHDDGVDLAAEIARAQSSRYADRQNHHLDDDADGQRVYGRRR